MRASVYICAVWLYECVVAYSAKTFILKVSSMCARVQKNTQQVTSRILTVKTLIYVRHTSVAQRRKHSSVTSFMSMIFAHCRQCVRVARVRTHVYKMHMYHMTNSFSCLVTYGMHTNLVRYQPRCTPTSLHTNLVATLYEYMPTCVKILNCRSL